METPRRPTAAEETDNQMETSRRPTAAEETDNQMETPRRSMPAEETDNRMETSRRSMPAEETDNQMEKSRRPTAAEETDNQMETPRRPTAAEETDNQMETSQRSRAAEETDNRMETSQRSWAAEETDNRMETSQFDQLLLEQWKTAAQSSCDPLHLERDDLRQILEFDSWDDLQKQMAEGRGDRMMQQEFVMLAHSFLKLKTFSNSWLCQISPGMEVSVLWGTLRLVLKLVQEETSAIPIVLQILHESCRKIEILNNYFAAATSFSAELKESCVETAVSFLRFLSFVVKFMRQDVMYVIDGKYPTTDWQPFQEQSASLSRQIDEVLSRVEKLSKFSRPNNQLDRKNRIQEQPGNVSTSPRKTSLLEEQAKLPCVILPSIRTSRFFDRTDIIEKMENHFNGAGLERSFRSLTLHGLGGVGKSTVALRFAENKLQRGELDALFWIYSEKLVSIRQSFTDIALRLMLPDARQGDHDENISLVLNWLQHTRTLVDPHLKKRLANIMEECRWLIVFDNAEIAELMQAHWPLARRGQALVTTRNPSIAFELTDQMIEVTSWDNETGLKFLLHLVMRDVTAEEASSAQELSEKLSGHALAISAMAGLIHRRGLSITEFMSFYSQYPSRMHGISGNRSINALWDMSFKSLDPSSLAVLGVMSFVEPDNIPQAIFEPTSSKHLPELLQFCSDPFLFSDAIENLLTLALIKRDPASRSFSLHRLVQMAFKYFMTPEQRQLAFNDATVLIHEAFPRRENNPLAADLYQFWDQCAKYLRHVISLKDFFREETKLSPNFTALQRYCNLNNSCQRYLLEINSLDDLEDLIEINTMAMGSMPEEEQVISLQGSLTSHRGQLYLRLGRSEEGVKWLRKSYEVRSRDVPLKPLESAWAADNLAAGLGSINNFIEALEWCKIAHDHYIDGSGQQYCNSAKSDPTLMINTAANLFRSGETEPAKTLLNEALKQIESEKPYDWYRASETHSQLGLIDRHDRKFESAEAHIFEAQNLYMKADGMRSHPLNAANMYRLGCIALDQGKVETAIKHLNGSLEITQMRKHNMVAEHMRVLFKLSEALEQDPRSETEARKMRSEAETLFYQRAPSASAPSLESSYDNLIILDWR